MKRTLEAIGFLGMVAAFCAFIAWMGAVAYAAPPPAQAQEAPRLSEQCCAIVADMALVARSLAVEKVGRALAARVMAQVYVSSAGSEAAVLIRERVLATAYGRSDAPMDFARMVGSACLRSGGDQDAMFGTGVRWRPLPRVTRGLRT